MTGLKALLVPSDRSFANKYTEEIDDGSGTRSKQWKSGLELEAGISKPMKGLDELWPFITTMKMADGDGKNDKGLSNKNVLSVVGRLMGKTYHQFLDEVEELSPETNDDILTVKEVNKYLRKNQKQVVYVPLLMPWNNANW
jgi:hypothetical protein